MTNKVITIDLLKRSCHMIVSKAGKSYFIQEHDDYNWSIEDDNNNVITVMPKGSPIKVNRDGEVVLKIEQVNKLFTPYITKKVNLSVQSTEA